MAEVNNPHDSYFKLILARPDAVTDFLINYLPPEVVAQLDLSAPELMKDSFVDPELQQHFADLLYRVGLKSGGAAYVGILFEHKSAPDKLVSFQVLRYKVRIWEPMIRQKVSTLPPIFPIVVYHGRSPWQVARNFGALIAAEATSPLQKYEPQFEYYLVDLSALSDEEIKGAVFLRVGLLLLKYIFTRRLWGQLPLILGLLPVPEQSALEYFSTSMRYVEFVRGRMTESIFQEVVFTAFPALGEKLMQAFNASWIEQGIQQGIQQGRQDGIAALTLRLLQRRIGKVSAETETRIHALSVEQLENLGEACLDFSQPEDLVGWFQANAS